MQMTPEIAKPPAGKIVVDLDGTITFDEDCSYADKRPNVAVIEKLHSLKRSGYQIVIFTARNMKTYSGSLGKINVHTLPVIMEWLQKHDVPFDEVIVGKPWCGTDGFYVDDKAIRPSELVNLTLGEIQGLLQKENSKQNSGQ